MLIRPLDELTWCAQSVGADLRPLCLGVRVDLDDLSVARPLFPISSPLTHMVYILRFFFSFLAGSKIFFFLSARPSDPDTMTITALEDTASSPSIKKWSTWISVS